jgi:glycosyltransferase involved in cell wall biosynthesis
MDRKKRVGFVTNSAIGVKTGFSRNIRALLEFLYKKYSDRYEIFHLAQSTQEGDPRLSATPWKTFPTFTREILSTERFHKDQGYQRLVSYGNEAVENFTVSNQLDVLIHIEDIWSSSHDAYWKKDYYDFIKDNFLNWTTLDSLPILPDAKTWATKTKNFWTWASFASNALKEEDVELYGHVDYVSGTLNCDQFKPLSFDEKREMRKKFNIPLDDIIINMTSRNQLRKSFFSNIEALAKYKKQYPESKRVRLLFHTSWTDGGGWPLDRIRDEFRLEKDDILTSYFCQKCHNWSIMPYVGEPLKCPYCGEDHAYITAGITSTITETDLAKIYGFCDAMSHPFTSGGLEYAMPEGLLCGLPLATTGYSCGTDFTEQPFVEKIDFTLTREVGTAFYKAVANPNSIVKFFKKIAEMTPEKRRQIGQQGREWAISRFHIDYVGKRVVDFIDNCKPLDWAQYKTKKMDYDVKVPNAVIPNDIEDDTEFIKTLYSKILKMEVADNDEGLVGWVQSIKQVPDNLVDQKREVKDRIIMSFRKIAREHNVKNNPIKPESFVDKDRPNKRAIFTVKESGGDILICTALLKNYKEKNPDVDIYFCCEQKYFEILDGNPYIYKVIPWMPEFDSEMFCIGAGQDNGLFDYFIYPTVCTQKFLSYLSNEGVK